MFKKTGVTIKVGFLLSQNWEQGQAILHICGLDPKLKWDHPGEESDALGQEAQVVV